MTRALNAIAALGMACAERSLGEEAQRGAHVNLSAAVHRSRSSYAGIWVTA
jgi:hypothetical protein